MSFGRFGDYLVQSEIDAGVRNPDGSYVDPALGSQIGIFGEAEDAILDNINSGNTFYSKLKDRIFDDNKGLKGSSPSGSGSGVASFPVLPEYINAEYAKLYGMDVATAYQEALANSAHQREVKDLQAAGLNPVLSTRYGGASGVSGAQVFSSGSSSGGSSGSSESSNSPLKMISGLAIIAGTVAGIASKRPSIGYAVTNAVSALDKLLDF